MPNKLNRSDVAQFILFDFRFSSSACIHLNNICVILKRSTITIECRGSIRVSTVHGHKYSSPSICYCIFHIKPHLKKKYLKLSLGRFLWNLFQETQNSLNFICFLSAWFLFSSDLNTNVDFSDFICGFIWNI